MCCCRWWCQLYAQSVILRGSIEKNEQVALTITQNYFLISYQAYGINGKAVSDYPPTETKLKPPIIWTVLRGRWKTCPEQTALSYKMAIMRTLYPSSPSRTCAVEFRKHCVQAPPNMLDQIDISTKYGEGRTWRALARVTPILQFIRSFDRSRLSIIKSHSTLFSWREGSAILMFQPFRSSHRLVSGRLFTT